MADPPWDPWTGLPEEAWPRTAAARKAVLGREALYPLDGGSDRLHGRPLPGPPGGGYPTLDDLVLAPPLFTPRRLAKMYELGREPLFGDVDTTVEVGGFRARTPVAVASMGSTGVANRRRLGIAAGAARAGAILGIGENVVTVRGYDRRLTEEPCLKEALLAYLDHVADGYGGLLVQQSVEDANFELWNKVYSDPDLAPFFDRGLVGFEIKVGQGAKPGLGGELRVPREVALRLARTFYFPDDPSTVVRATYERHAAPGTFMPDILEEMVRLARNNYPRARIWVKTGAYRDLPEQLDLLARAGADAVTVDGAEGGTAMAPVAALEALGLPTVACLAAIAAARARGVRMPILLSGGLRGGADVVKALCLGATAVAMGRPLVIAAHGRAEVLGELRAVADAAEGVANFLEATRVEVQLLASALGKYALADLGPEDVRALRPDLARALGIASVFDAPTGGPRGPP